MADSPDEYRILKNAVAPMSDGVALRADVYLRAGEHRRPTILLRTPYGKDDAPLAGWLSVLRAVERDWVVVIQDTRGRHASDGDFRPLVDDPADAAATIAWIREQSWSDGDVCMAGASYVGATQWLAAGAAPPGLRAIAPATTSATFADGWFTEGGVLQAGFLWNWVIGYLAPPDIRRIDDPDAQAAAARYLAALAARDMPASAGEILEVLAPIAPYVDEWDRALAGRSAWPSAAGPADVPALVIGGWFDIFLAGTLRSFAAARAEGSRLIIGPWAHGVTGGRFPEVDFGPRSSTDAIGLSAMTLDWFDDVRRGSARGGVTLFVMGRNEWRQFDSWPPAGASPRDLFLDGAGVLLEEPAPVAGEIVLSSDPRDPVPTVGGRTYLPGLFIGANSGPRDQAGVEDRDDVRVFTSRAFERAGTVIGPVACEVFVSARAETSVVAKLTRVGADGHSMLLCEGAARIPRSDRPRPLRLDLGGTACTVDAGDRLRVDVALSDWPRLAVDDGPRSVVIHCGADAPSFLRVHISTEGR